MKDKIKLVLSIALIIASLATIFKSFIGGILILLAGLVIYPKISEKLLKTIPIWKNRAVRIVVPILLFIFGASTNAIQNKDNIALGKKESVVIEYIKKNVDTDKSLSNLKILAETGALFNNGSYVLSSPPSHLQSKTDTITGITSFTLNPVYDFQAAIKSKYLKADSKKGVITDYQLIFEVDNNNAITSKKTIIEYANTGKEEFINQTVPEISKLIDNDVLASQKEVVKKQRAIAEKKAELNRTLGNDEFWNKFDPEVKVRIYNLVKEKNCSGLQKEFNTTADHMERFQKTKDTRARKHYDLMDVIDDKMREIGCYDK